MSKPAQPVAANLGCPPNEVVFTRNAIEAVNRIAQGRLSNPSCPPDLRLKPGAEVVAPK
ncbi:hypothetical protein [Streptomyces sp. NPDC047028]|uniref:hypothetical protein n=1 Tax=Streptomyces sp. NPDC047028 TaxID=3155793 RepID=UPI0033F96E6C